MKKILMLTVFIVVFTNSLICDETKQKQHINSYSFEIKANVKTKIVLLDEEEKLIYTLYDNLLERDAIVKIVNQKEFWDKNSSDSNIVFIPIPVLNSGLYYFKLESVKRFKTIKFISLK
jgi:hypothetical protein